MECDDLKMETSRFGKAEPNFPASLVHVLMWEKTGTVQEKPLPPVRSSSPIDVDSYKPLSLKPDPGINLSIIPDSNQSAPGSSPYQSGSSHMLSKPSNGIYTPSTVPKITDSAKDSDMDIPGPKVEILKNNSGVESSQKIPCLTVVPKPNQGKSEDGNKANKIKESKQPAESNGPTVTVNGETGHAKMANGEVKFTNGHPAAGNTHIQAESSVTKITNGDHAGITNGHSKIANSPSKVSKVQSKAVSGKIPAQEDSGANMPSLDDLLRRRSPRGGRYTPGKPYQPDVGIEKKEIKEISSPPRVTRRRSVSNEGSTLPKKLPTRSGVINSTSGKRIPPDLSKRTSKKEEINAQARLVVPIKPKVSNGISLVSPLENSKSPRAGQKKQDFVTNSGITNGNHVGITNGLTKIAVSPSKVLADPSKMVLSKAQTVSPTVTLSPLPLPRVSVVGPSMSRNTVPVVSPHKTLAGNIIEKTLLPKTSAKFPSYGSQVSTQQPIQNGGNPVPIMSKLPGQIPYQAATVLPQNGKAVTHRVGSAGRGSQVAFQKKGKGKKPEPKPEVNARLERIRQNINELQERGLLERQIRGQPSSLGVTNHTQPKAFVPPTANNVTTGQGAKSQTQVNINKAPKVSLTVPGQTAKVSGNALGVPKVSYLSALKPFLDLKRNSTPPSSPALPPLTSKFEGYKPIKEREKVRKTLPNLSLLQNGRKNVMNKSLSRSPKKSVTFSPQKSVSFLSETGEVSAAVKRNLLNFDERNDEPPEKLRKIIDNMGRKKALPIEGKYGLVEKVASEKTGESSLSHKPRISKPILKDTPERKSSGVENKQKSNEENSLNGNVHGENNTNNASIDNRKGKPESHPVGKNDNNELDLLLHSLEPLASELWKCVSDETEKAGDGQVSVDLNTSMTALDFDTDLFDF